MKTPFFYVDEALLTRNLEILRGIMDRSGCKILLAQKAFSMYALYPLIGKYLSGTTASGLYEARLGREEMDGEVHVFSPAYTDAEMDELLGICDCAVFNSFGQWEKFRERAMKAGIKCGIRVNPEFSTGSHSIYDPCAAGSRLGVTAANFRPELLGGISGLHFHTLCEQYHDDLLATVEAVEEKFGQYLHGLEWLNIGGGHHITRSSYDIGALESCIGRLRGKYGVNVYIEPGEAVVLDTGFLESTVIDIVDNGIKIAILDVSAACHMPDVLEMPYRPLITRAESGAESDATAGKSGEPGEYPHCYRLAGPTCLAGDIIGDYSFAAPLKIGDRLTFHDMAHYSMVKTNTFNGMPLPAIAVKRGDGRLEAVKSFGYEDFKSRV